jgi:hypothetical protein
MWRQTSTVGNEKGGTKEINANMVTKVPTQLFNLISLYEET